MAEEFIEYHPTKESCWRAIILMGRNVASYKFSLAKSLIQLQGLNKTFISLEELALPFSKNICEHLKISSKQITSPSSKFIETCNRFNEEEISETKLVEVTTKLGFVNVIDAFHIVSRDSTPIRFFEDDRKSKGGITITDDFFKLTESNQFKNLPNEVESRWRLVETAWDLNISPNLIGVGHDEKKELFYASIEGFRRKDITSSRDALNGYQKGKCFYCLDNISIIKGDLNLADVDHFFPHRLTSNLSISNLNGVWNLVLACRNCNRGGNGKFDRIPEVKFLDRLNSRNNFLISSHHPLRQTLILQTGTSSEQRQNYLQTCYHNAKQILIHSWKPEYEYPATF
ncbi:MAG: HNH endonuclease [Nitrospinae bacterium]|nr:HNH endonuclease [Nitrospinota bacterium]MBL7020857.1 HNH endonuclease [Nitrospinaceae bacterium]